MGFSPRVETDAMYECAQKLDKLPRDVQQRCLDWLQSRVNNNVIYGQPPTPPPFTPSSPIVPPPPSDEDLETPF